MLKLRVDTPKEWLDIVLADFDAFLINHAACERKVASTNMNFVVRYPDRTEILEPIIKMAREELEHFHRVYKIITARGLQLGPDTKDEYINLLRKHVRSSGEDRLLDMLLVCGIIEARGCERMGMVAVGLQDPYLKDFYLELTRCEARHHGQFIRLAGHYFDEATIEKRLNQFLDFEAEAISQVPLKSALY